MADLCLCVQEHVLYHSVAGQARDGWEMFLQVTSTAGNESSSQLTRKPVPVPTGTVSRMRWGFTRACAPDMSSWSI